MLKQAVHVGKSGPSRSEFCEYPSAIHAHLQGEKKDRLDCQLQRLNWAVGPWLRSHLTGTETICWWSEPLLWD
jgi:hypothetical protein